MEEETQPIQPEKPAGSNRKVLPILIIILFVVIVGGAVAYFMLTKDSSTTNTNTVNSNYANTNLSITTFEECADATGVVMESYPRRCVINGQTFTENVNANANTNTTNSATNQNSNSNSNTNKVSTSDLDALVTATEQSSQAVNSAIGEFDGIDEDQDANLSL